ncbi:MAG: histidine triad (HIT) family protein [Candidatus Paceibacteria bacterium]|jgi:histidine triad (HIT) family protein
MATIFTKIIEGELPCHKVWEDEAHLAFLDIRPAQPGHTLVIPKREVSYLFEMDEEEHAALWAAAHKVARNMKRVLGCERVCVTVIGWEVPHVHIHLIPTNHMHEVGMPAPTEVAEEQMLELAQQLKF